jgi:LPXTG-site transpeptidase (sortase) family protein
MKRFRPYIKRVLFCLFFAILFSGSFLLSAKNNKVIASPPVSVTPSSSPISSKTKEFGIKIDKIDILAPVIKDVDGSNKTEYLKKLKEGVAHFKNSALPGDKKGNIFIFGHSSSASGTGEYSKIFARFDELQENDEITIFYQNKELKYKITDKSIVEATDLSVLDQTKKERLTLMTCWPIGTKDKRLIIVGEPL